MESTRMDRRIERRLNAPITTGETAALILGLVLAVFVYVVGRREIGLILPEPTDIGLILVYLICGLGLPAFFSLLLGMTVPSWRYKTISGVLLLFVLVTFSVLDVIGSMSNGFSALRGSVIRLGVRLSAALAAFRLWRAWQDAKAAKAEAVNTLKITVNEKMPRTPAFLLFLSLVSIPATYISIVLSMFVTIGLSALLYLVLSELPRVPVVLIVAAVLAPIGAAWASLKALRVALAPAANAQAAHVIMLEERPVLNALVENVCQAVNARMPDNVILNADPTFYVTQSKVTTFHGPVKGRTLALGLPLVKAMDASELSSVLAHEFAHFSGRDTLYSTLAAPVFRGLQTSVQVLATARRSGSSTVAAVAFLQLPSFHFLMACAMHFHSITMIISRRRELRADWIAARSFGTPAFASALRKSVEIASHFPESMKALSWSDTRGFFSAYAALLDQEKAKLEILANKALEEGESEFSSHPALRTRFESLPLFKASVMTSTGDLHAELAEDEARLSEAFAPVIADYQKRLRPDETEPEHVTDTSES